MNTNMRQYKNMKFQRDWLVQKDETIIFLCILHWQLLGFHFYQCDREKQAFSMKTTRKIDEQIAK